MSIATADLLQRRMPRARPWSARNHDGRRMGFQEIDHEPIHRARFSRMLRHLAATDADQAQLSSNYRVDS